MLIARTLALVGVVWSLQLPPHPQRSVIAVSRALDGRGGTLTDTRIVVENGRIAAIDPSAGPVDHDLRGLTVMPGWIDTHVHLSWYFDASGRLSTGGNRPDDFRAAAENARLTVLAGFTTIQSLGAPVDRAVRDAVARRELPGPRILTSLTQLGDPSMSPDGLRALVRRIPAGGGDLVKVIAGGGYDGGPHRTMSGSQLEAICGEARAAAMRAAAHAIADGEVRAAVEAGCTSIEHGSGASDRTLDLMARRGTYFDPNLLMLHNYIDNAHRFGQSDAAVEDLQRAVATTARALRRARERGVRIVFGTDAVAGAHGRNAEEFVYRVRDAREKPADVLASATSGAAESLGLGTTIGAIAPGYDADLVATDGNPLDDIRAVRRVVFVMSRGRVLRAR